MRRWPGPRPLGASSGVPAELHAEGQERGLKSLQRKKLSSVPTFHLRPGGTQKPLEPAQKATSASWGCWEMTSPLMQPRGLLRTPMGPWAK